MIRGVWVDPDAGRIPFGKYAARWVAERPVRTRTREIYEGQLRHIVLVFANVHLCDVHPVDVRTWHGRLAASGLHHNTVAKIYRLFRSIMTTAVDDGLIARNPVHIKGASAERMAAAPAVCPARALRPQRAEGLTQRCFRVRRERLRRHLHGSSLLVVRRGSHHR
jgi:site-specific recombinase XerC